MVLQKWEIFTSVAKSWRKRRVSREYAPQSRAKPQLIRKLKLQAIYTPLRGKTGSEAQMEYIFTLVGLLYMLNWIQLIALKLSRAAGVHGDGHY